jgi:hypothetical protein
MFEILEEIPEKHVTRTREMTVVSARCLNCGKEQLVLLQNANRANRLRRKCCKLCLPDTFHLMTETRFWRIWKGMVSRATDPRNKDFTRYGGAGRGVCEDWLDFGNFYRDMYESYADDLTIDRRDNSKGYCLENCRWVPNLLQQSNKTNNRVIQYGGCEMHLAEFCRVTGMSRGAATPRLNSGMTGDEALLDYQKSTYKKGRRSRQFTTLSTVDPATGS